MAPHLIVFQCIIFLGKQKCGQVELANSAKRYRVFCYRDKVSVIQPNAKQILHALIHITYLSVSTSLFVPVNFCENLMQSYMLMHK